jgi:hypothetical protein
MDDLESINLQKERGFQSKGSDTVGTITESVTLQ